ncbi:MAG: DnaJ domain-containing protein [Polyangiaceae bacterium]|nr:DnaJ domain-containing protein [Polyangiaceae bacterium]
MENCYDTLGIAETATPEEIKRAFREKAKRHHPDHNPTDVSAAERFKAAVAAHDILSDPAKRKAHDQQLLSARQAKARQQSSATGRSPIPPTPTPTARPRYTTGDAVAATALAALLAIMASGGGSRRSTSRRRAPRVRWDSRVGRYRDTEGRFVAR